MKAYELIDTPEKWCKGVNHEVFDGVHRYCPVGAVQECYPHHQWWIEVRKAKQSIKGSLSNWNDAPERTHAEVYGLLKALDI